MRAVLFFLFWSCVFGVSYTQAPLYYSNQNQYFLHGLAAAGRGDLDQDWLAKTKDPTPIFSGLVACTAGYLHEWCFYLYYLLVLGLYFYSLLGIFSYLTGETGAAPRMPAKLCFIALFVVLHAGIVRWASVRLLGDDYPWFLQAGVAGQYVLGFGLQPSVFGVFLLVSILAFLRDQPWRAVIWACLAGVLHATYLLAAALLVLAYMALCYRQRRVRGAVLVGGLALALVMPSVVYNLVTFAPTSAADFAETQYILARIRIPHHAVVARWFDGIALAQVLWIALATYLARGSRLFVIMLVVFLGSMVLTLLQLATNNDTLALLFPWRTSAILVPMATTVVVSRIVIGLSPLVERRGFTRSASRAACVLALGACFVGGLAISYFGLGYQSSSDELPMLEFIRTNHRRGEVYLVPVDLPKPSNSRGVYSSNFKPIPRRGHAGMFLAVDLQGFRLATGTPLYVDYKSIPYQDTEVLKWHGRVLWNQEVYANSLTDDLRAELGEKGITHVVVPAANMHNFSRLRPPLYEDEAYGVFSVANK